MTPRPTRRTTLRAAAIVLVTIVAALIVVPLVWPVPPLTDTVDPHTLADADSRFTTIGGISVHYKMWGMPSQIASSSATTGSVDTAIVLLHGFGASTFSWHTVAGALSERLPVVAFDRPAFGLTERPMTWSGPDPYAPEAQADLTVKLMDRLGIRRAVLIGHSAGGTVAALVAARYPDRVAAVILEDPAVFNGGPPAFLAPVFRTPQFRRIGPLLSRSLAGQAGTDFIKSAWHDPSRITAETYEGYRTPLRTTDWDEALWLLTIAPRPSDVPGVVRTIRAPVLFMTGDDDRIVPPADTRRAADLVEGSR
ncbi:MAG: alpha/beta hydrolase, partial [Coriobacteriia bacterium]|nr:alpha/beta hydrolase [Coriobacteriia bacterium]